MILIGLGGNLPSTVGEPLATCLAALDALREGGVEIEAVSPWYETAPLPASDQPWFINGVTKVTTALDPAALLTLMHKIEATFGRARTTANAARALDLDLLAYGTVVRESPPPALPHPRLHQRSFVLMPLRDIAPAWKHPALGLTAAEMAVRLPPGQLIRPLSKGQFAAT